MNHFQPRMASSQKKCTLDGKILLTYYYEKKKNKMATEMVKLLRNEFDTPVFKVLVFASALTFELKVDIPTQILLTMMELIDHSSRCKLKVYPVIAHTKDKPSTAN